MDIAENRKVRAVATHKRYLVLALIAGIWMLVLVAANSVAGGSAQSIATLAWASVIYYAVTGNIQGIKTTAKIVAILQIVGGGIVFALLNNNVDMQNYFGPPELFLIGLAGPTLVWIGLYLWASSRVEKINTENDAGSNAQAVRLVSSFSTQEYARSSQVEHSSSQPRDALAQSSAVTHVERQNSAPLHVAGVDEASAILLKYNDEARAAYSKLKEYSVEWQNEYRQRLVENPAQDPAALVGMVVLNFLGRPDLAWSSDIWDALESARKLNEAARDEFIKVFSLLSHTMTPAVIARKVIDASLGTLRYTYLVVDEKEVEQKVYFYTSGYFSLDGFSEFFPSIQSVYEHLNTPKSKRVALYFLDTVE